MKIRNLQTIRRIAAVASVVVRVWMKTVRIQRRALARQVDPPPQGNCPRYIYIFWHENILVPASLFGRPDVNILVSKHADGELIAKVAEYLGFSTTRGSSTRDGIAAIRSMMRTGLSAHLSMTPDGPRGPRRRVQDGLIYLASRTGLPIVPIGIAYSRPWRAGSWDKMVIPRPLSKAFLVTVPPIQVPPGLTLETLGPWREEVERQMVRVEALAEAWCKNRKFDPEAVPDSPGAVGERPDPVELRRAS